MILVDSMGHLYSTESIEELYDFAVNKMKLKPQWNHYSRHFPHFDLTTKNKINQSIKLGARLVDARDDKEEYDKCRAWARKMYQEEWEEKENKYFYESKGLVGQKILRIDFNKLPFLNKTKEKLKKEKDELDEILNMEIK